MERDEETRRKAFRILSHAAMKKAAGGICKAVIPIYGHGDDNKPVHVASGILLMHEGIHFLATAAHVTDHSSSKTLSIPTPVGPLRELRGDSIATLAPEGNRDLDRYDLAVVKLPPALVHDLVGARYVQQSECSSENILEQGHHCMVFGFPNSKNNDIDHAKRTVRVKKYSYGGISHRNPGVSAKLKLVGDDHLLVRHITKSQDEHGTIGKSISVRGVSGGAVLDLGHIENRTCDARLAGIFIEHHQEHGFAVATRIESLFAAIERGKTSNYI